MPVTPSGKVRAHIRWTSPLRMFFLTAGVTTCLMAASHLTNGQDAPAVVAKADRLVSEIVEPDVTLDPGRSKLLRTTKPVSRISVPNPGVVEILQFSPTEFELIGGTSGETDLTLWLGEEHEDKEILRYLVRVEPNRTIETEQTPRNDETETTKQKKRRRAWTCRAGRRRGK